MKTLVAVDLTGDIYRVLCKEPGFEVVGFNHFKEALEYARDNTLDLAVTSGLDYKSPPFPKFVRGLRESQEHYLPVIAYPGYNAGSHEFAQWVNETNSDGVWIDAAIPRVFKGTDIRPRKVLLKRVHILLEEPEKNRQDAYLAFSNVKLPQRGPYYWHSDGR